MLPQSHIQSPPARRTAEPAARTLILGLGNPLLTDDAAGLRVLEHLRPLLADRPHVELAEECAGGLRLMERLVGFERAIIVDATYAGAPPGTLRILTVDELPPRRSGSAHDVHLCTALQLGRQAGAALPADDQIRIVALEAAEVFAFGQRCTPGVAAAVPRAAALVLSLIANWR